MDDENIIKNKLYRTKNQFDHNVRARLRQNLSKNEKGWTEYSEIRTSRWLGQKVASFTAWGGEPLSLFEEPSRR